MSDVNTAEMQHRILTLKAELDALSLQLIAGTCDETALKAGEPGLPVTADETPRAAEGPEFAIDHVPSLRTLRDLMWQGRWGLAFHLARALEAQDAPGLDFHSSIIRAWAFAAKAERCPNGEALELIQNLQSDARRAGNGSLSERIFEWATLIGLLRAVDPNEVRECTAQFVAPGELPATAAWWNHYVDSLTAAPRPASRWVQLPEHQQVLTEIEAFMIDGPAEPVRLAASCLMMSVRNAMRHVQVAGTADKHCVLDLELARSSMVEFAGNGDVVSPAAVVERAVCELAATTPGGRRLVVAETPSKAMPAPEAAVAEILNPLHLMELTEERTPRAEPALSLLESIEDALRTVVHADGEQTTRADESLRAVRREAARARLNRYSERLAARGADAPPVSIPFRTLLVSSELKTGESMTVPGAPMNTDPIPADTPIRMSSGRVVSEASPVVNSDQRRGIHEMAVARSFGNDAGWQTPRSAPVTSRAHDNNSLMDAFLNPQAAIVAGLLVIGSAAIAGLGTGLRARAVVETPTAGASTDAAAEPVGDFSTVQ